MWLTTDFWLVISNYMKSTFLYFHVYVFTGAYANRRDTMPVVIVEKIDFPCSFQSQSNKILQSNIKLLVSKTIKLVSADYKQFISKYTLQNSYK